MNLDGEWRVAFIKKRAARAQVRRPRRCPSTTRMPQLYGAGYINGTIIGIPKCGEAQGRGLGARQVPGDEHEAPGAALERDRERADHDGVARTRRSCKPDPHFATFLKIFTNPNTTTTPITIDRRAEPEPVQHVHH